MFQIIWQFTYFSDYLAIDFGFLLQESLILLLANSVLRILAHLISPFSLIEDHELDAMVGKDENR